MTLTFPVEHKYTDMVQLHSVCVGGGGGGRNLPLGLLIHSIVRVVQDGCVHNVL